MCVLFENILLKRLWTHKFVARVFPGDDYYNLKKKKLGKKIQTKNLGLEFPYDFCTDAWLKNYLISGKNSLAAYKISC